MSAGERPYEPAAYPVVVIGSGPGGLQTSYFLRRAGVDHAVISADEEPGGMFLKFPLFQRLITWTKLHALADHRTRQYERFDWNSMLAREDEARGLVADFMDGTSYFPSRPEMEKGIQEFANKAKIPVRYGCRWESTRLEDGGFSIGTSDGEYRAKVLVVATGMTEPWTPSNIPGIEHVPHYVDVGPGKDYAGKRVFVIGKRNSGFEVADALLPWVRWVVVGSPRPVRLSVMLNTTAAARARYIQPYEDHVLGGGNVVLDAAIERIERTEGGFIVHASGTTRPGDHVLEVEEVIAATGFTTPLGDLPDLGVATFYQGRLPAQTPFWESVSVENVYFAGSITQGAIGLKKYGIPSNSAAVHGFRYNSQVLADHIARTHFDAPMRAVAVEPSEVIEHLLREATHAPELWNQQSYLARTLVFDEEGIRDEGFTPLAHFVDASGPDAIALTLETDGDGEIHPAAYVRRRGEVEEHLLEPNEFHNFVTDDNRRSLASVLGGWIE